MTELVNKVTASLQPYPMEELARIKANLAKQGKKIFDFGTGDPKLPTWEPIRSALLDAVQAVSQYPSVKGKEALREAQKGYLKRRLGLSANASWEVYPTYGSKEAIFNIALSLCGRNGRRTLVYPDPGYPVYRASALFSGGKPYPVQLTDANDYRFEPWNLPRDVIEDTFALWINYPHNPTGAVASRKELEKLVSWCHSQDIVLLVDDCYLDIYDEGAGEIPTSPIAWTQDRVISFMSLSKRSGITGYRSGFMAGDARILAPVLRARANFGVGCQDFVQDASIVAWNDDQHVAERRKVFAKRMKIAGDRMKALGLIDRIPTAAFYLWAKVPKSFAGDDVACVLALAEAGVIASPSQWLSEGLRGFFRLAMVPDEHEMDEALRALETFVRERA